MAQFAALGLETATRKVAVCSSLYDMANKIVMLSTVADDLSCHHSTLHFTTEEINLKRFLSV